MDAFLSPDHARLLAAGRLSDGRSFALSIAYRGREMFFLLPENSDSERDLSPSPAAIPDAESWRNLEGHTARRFFLPPGQDRRGGRVQGFPRGLVDAPSRPAWDVLAEMGIGVLVEIEGEARTGHSVDLYFEDPVLRACPEDVGAKLIWLALDIETDREARVTALSLACGDLAEVLFLGPETGMREARSFGSERELLEGLCRRIRELDPDIITGWNVLDFDFRVLASRYASLRIPFEVGRTKAPVEFLASEGSRRGSFVNIQGRVVLDAMRLVRATGIRFEDQSLDTVARRILGGGKSVSERGEEKLAKLESLRKEDPAAFCAYCLADSTLVLDILRATGLDELTLKRSVLTGTGPDIAWASIPVFERVYGAELRRRHIIPLARSERDVSGAAGGTILEPRAGLFDRVLVFDFRSLYPSIMRTFNIDPLARAAALAAPSTSDIVAPNGARFSREEGIMPSLIGKYASEREKALAAGDDTAAFVHKILQNSFYGVLGSSRCAYARTDLAGAITSFARKFLHASRDWFESGGRAVLYGDTDSVFVKAKPSDGTGFESLAASGASLAAELDAFLARIIFEEYGRKSFLKMRCEKVYGRFLIPRLRIDEGASEGRGRSKGYAGLELGGSGGRVEIVGMEAVRSDWTALARRFQTELVTMVFRDAGVSAVRDFCRLTEAETRSGRLDAELVYRKNLRRPVSAYASASPQVRAARLMGWTNRHGIVSYLMTVRGARPVGESDTPVDYDHYVEKQLVPIARAVAAACGWKTEGWFAGSAQLDFDFL